MNPITVEIEPAIFNDAYVKHLDNMDRTQIFFWRVIFGQERFSCPTRRY